MSRSNNGKPFYVDVGTSIVAIRCASNRDVLIQYDFGFSPTVSNIVPYTKEICDRMNKEAEIGRPLRNCDVGTAEEQHKRFMHFCTHVNKSVCMNCPLIGNTSLCQLQWAQMPYTKGETK